MVHSMHNKPTDIVGYNISNYMGGTTASYELLFPTRGDAITWRYAEGAPKPSEVIHLLVGQAGPGSQEPILDTTAISDMITSAVELGSLVALHYNILLHAVLGLQRRHVGITAPVTTQGTCIQCPSVQEDRAPQIKLQHLQEWYGQTLVFHASMWTPLELTVLCLMLRGKSATTAPDADVGPDCNVTASRCKVDKLVKRILIVGNYSPVQDDRLLSATVQCPDYLLQLSWKLGVETATMSDITPAFYLASRVFWANCHNHEGGTLHNACSHIRLPFIDGSRSMLAGLWIPQGFPVECPKLITSPQIFHDATVLAGIYQQSLLGMVITEFCPALGNAAMPGSSLGPNDGWTYLIS